MKYQFILPSVNYTTLGNIPKLAPLTSTVPVGKLKKMPSVLNLALGIPLLCRVPNRGHSAKPFGFYPNRPHTYTHSHSHPHTHAHRTALRAAGPPSAAGPPPPAAGPPPSAAGRPPPAAGPRLSMPPAMAPTFSARLPSPGATLGPGPGAKPLPPPHGRASQQPVNPSSPILSELECSVGTFFLETNRYCVSLSLNSMCMCLIADA